MEHFSIRAIQPEWVLEPEALGSKKKFWYREPLSEAKMDWLFKYPQTNTGQHWAEKIAAEVASVLGIIHAPVELAVFEGINGSATKSFVHDGSDLYHGNQLLAGQAPMYDPQKEFRQADHTIDNIFKALDGTFDSDESRKRAKCRFLDYLLLDAVVGNTDRHHENWGVLRKRKESTWTQQMSPSFDHASSLGRELVDEGLGPSRRSLLQRGIGHYSEKARGAIYWASTDRKGLSPLELFRRVVVCHKDSCATALPRLKQLNRSVVEGIVQKIPPGWMSTLSRDFAVELMCYNLQELIKVEEQHGG